MTRRLLFVGLIVLLAMFFTTGMFSQANRLAIIQTPTPNPYPTPSVPRQGVAAAAFNNSKPYLSQLGSWVTLWSAYNGTYTTAFQIVPMLVWAQSLPSITTVQSIDIKTNHDYWVVFNECDNVFQCNKLPEIQAQFYHDQVLPLISDQGGDPNAKLIIGGVGAQPCGLNWLSRFVDAYRSLYHQDPPRAGWHFHIYPDLIAYEDGVPLTPEQPCPAVFSLGPSNRPISVTYYIEDAERIRHWWSLYGSPNDEIWITETGCLDYNNCPDTSTTDYIAAITAYLNDQGRWINRYAWYTDKDSSFPDTWLMSNSVSGTLTAIGTYYSQVKPSAHVPGFQYLSFLPIVLNNYGSGSQMMMVPSSLSPFASPLVLPKNSTFMSPLKIP